MTVLSGEKTDGFEDIVEIFAFDVLLEVVDVVGALEFFAHGDDEWAWYDLESFSLIDSKSEYIILLDLFFIDGFEDELLFSISDEVERAKLSVCFETGNDL